MTMIRTWPMFGGALTIAILICAAAQAHANSEDVLNEWPATLSVDTPVLISVTTTGGVRARYEDATRVSGMDLLVRPVPVFGVGVETATGKFSVGQARYDYGVTMYNVSTGIPGMILNMILADALKNPIPLTLDAGVGIGTGTIKDFSLGGTSYGSSAYRDATVTQWFFSLGSILPPLVKYHLWDVHLTYGEFAGENKSKQSALKDLKVKGDIWTLGLTLAF